MECSEHRHCLDSGRGFQESFLEKEGRLLPGRVLNMWPEPFPYPHPMLSVLDLDQGPQNWPAAEPGPCPSSTRSLGVQRPGSHCVADL